MPPATQIPSQTDDMSAQVNPRDLQASLEQDVPGTLAFFGSEVAELFSREIAESYRGVLAKNYQKKYGPFIPGYVTASIDNRYVWNQMWSRDMGTFMRELVLWGNLNHACLLAECVFQLTTKNTEGFYMLPEFWNFVQPASGSELDGTAATIVSFVLLWKRLSAHHLFRKKLYAFLHQDASPLAYIHRVLSGAPLIAGTGEFGGGMGSPGPWYNSVQNNLVRLALLAAASMETTAGDHERAALYAADAEKIRDNMERHLIGQDGAWIWCIHPTTLQPDPSVINSEANKGFGGLNGVACMDAEVTGFEPVAADGRKKQVCERTFEKLLSEPFRKEQFEKYGIWTQFDRLIGGCLTSPAYGQGYAIQTMLLYDKLEMADHALDFLARATFMPLPEYTELERESPYHFYERYYSPYAVGKVKLQQGCGALNLVNVAEPLKIARLIVGVDDISSPVVNIIPRVPPSWKGYTARSWPVQTENGVVRIDLDYTQESGARLQLVVRDGLTIPSLCARMPQGQRYARYVRHKVTGAVQFMV